MKISNLRIYIVFQTLMLLFCLLVFQPAISKESSLQTPLVELLTGKTADYTNVASLVHEYQLPTALAAASLLKFRALHGEGYLSANEANAFEKLILDRLSSSKLVAFSKNELCQKIVSRQKIDFNGQKLIVPMHYIADTTLAIIDFSPQGEAGCLFPDFNIEVFSQTRLAKISLVVDGLIVDSNSISQTQNANRFGLRHRTAALLESLLAIGTHSAQISIVNENGETAEKKWFFTVGVESFNPEPVPEEARLLGEISVPVSQLIGTAGHYQNVRVLIYEDGHGRKHEEYIVATGQGTIKVRNLRYLGRLLRSKRPDADFKIFPKTGNAFPGNLLRFFYKYSGEGRILESDYSLDGLADTWQNGTTYEETLGSDAVKVFFRIKVEEPDPEEESETISVHYQADHTVWPLIPKFSFWNPRNYIFTRENEGVLAFKRELQVIGVNAVLETGSKIFIKENGRGFLTVDDFRAEIVVSSGSVTLKDNIATASEIIFSSPGYIEITQSAKLVYSFDDEIYTQSFKDEKSSLNALFKVHAGCEFLKYPNMGLLSGTQVTMPLKHLSLQINGETKIYHSLADIEKPWVLLKSEHDPQMEPVILQNPYFKIADPAGNTDFALVDFGFRALAAVTDVPLALQPEFMVTPGKAPIKFASLQEFSILPLDSRLIEVEIDPPGPLKIYEGDTRPLAAAIVPAEGMGTGVFNAEENSLEILDFYKPCGIDYFEWLELPQMDEKAGRTIREAEFKHLFNPWWGTGNYDLTVDALVDFTTELGSTFYLKAASKTEVEVLPGLTILSPICDVAYPLGAALKVTTSVDEDLEKWKSIQWSLNGKNFIPDTQEPPFFITPDRAGKWSLVASLTIDAAEDREPVELFSEVKFSVQPVNYSLSPSRKVFARHEASDIAVDLIVKINGKQIEKPGQQVPWQGDTLLATVDKVDWELIQKEEGCASLKAAEDSFKAMVDFSSHGAVTALATITIRLTDVEKIFNRHNPHFKNRFEEPVFKLPAARTDLWAVTAGPMQEIAGRFPKTAIADAYRTYELASFSFDLSCDRTQKYAFNKETGLSKKIALEPALPGIDAIETSDVSFAWKAESKTSSISQQQESPVKLVIKPAEPCSYDVTLTASLNFTGSVPIKIGEDKTAAAAVPLSSLIETRVDPASFTLTLGETKQLKYLVRNLEFPDVPAITPQTDFSDKSSLPLINGDFILEIIDVAWSTNASTPDDTKTTIESKPYEFNAQIVGLGIGHAEGQLLIKENFPSGRSSTLPSIAEWLWNVEAFQLKIKNLSAQNGEDPFSDYFSVSSLGVTTNFQAIAFRKDGTEIGPVSVKWELEGGDVLSNQPVRQSILKELGPEVAATGKIGVLSDRNATCSTILDNETVKLISFLAGNIDLIATQSGIQRKISISLKQPFVKIRFYAVRGINLDLQAANRLVEKADKIWSGNSEHLLHVKVDSFIWIENEFFELLPPDQASEYLLFDKPSFLNPIVADRKADLFFDIPGHEINKHVVPRQIEKLLEYRTKTNINVYLPSWLYSRLDTEIELLETHPGATISSRRYIKKQNISQLIDDSKESGIVLSYDTGSLHNGDATTNQLLAHEIGHILNLDHIETNMSYLMHPTALGTKISAQEFISVLNLRGSNNLSSLFVMEEE